MSRFKNAFATRLALTILLVMALTGPGYAAKVNLNFAMWISTTTQTEVDAQQQLMQKYMDANPDVNIELTLLPWGGYPEKLMTMAAGGLAPDVMVLSRLHLPNFAESGLVQPIDQWFNKESTAFRRDIVEIVSGTYKDKFYGIPIWGGPTIVAYNADRFENAGLTQPYALAQKKAWTWDTFVNFGKKITQDSNGDSVNDVFMHARLGTRAADWYIKLRSFGADVITSSGKPVSDVTAIEKGLQFWSDLAWQHHIAPTGKESSNFTKGTEAMYFTWISDTPNHYKNVKGAFRMEMTTPPTGPAGQFTIVGGCPITVSSSTPNAYEAYKFAKWYAMESGHWKVRGTPPSYNDMRRDYRTYLAEMFTWPDAVVEAMSGAISMEPGVGKYFTDLNAAWNQALSGVAAGSMAPREGAIRIVEATQRILGAGN